MRGVRVVHVWGTVDVGLVQAAVRTRCTAQQALVNLKTTMHLESITRWVLEKADVYEECAASLTPQRLGRDDTAC